MSETELFNTLENARKDLENLVVIPRGDLCPKFAVEVLKNTKVQQAFISHIRNNEDFSNLTCHPFGRDAVQIVFTFRCRAPRICIVAPAFAVHYDPLTQSVGEITDPYISITW